MRVRDKNIDEKILKVAKSEFLEKGYSEVSLRGISKKAGVTTGAIYSRYKNKDELFYCICEDTIKMMKSVMFDCTENIENYKEKWLEDPSILNKVFYEHEKIIFKNLLGLELLFYKSQGSKLSDYKNILTKVYINNVVFGIETYKSEADKKIFKIPETSSTYMLIRTLASSYVAYIEELILRKTRNINDKEYYIYIDNVSRMIFEIFKLIFKYINEL